MNIKTCTVDRIMISNIEQDEVFCV